MVKRISWFLIMLAAGTALGLFYGWVIHPGEEANAPLSALRQDYQTEAVLMVAEVLHQDGNVNAAAETLSQLRAASPAVTAAEAAAAARTAGYSLDDLNLMNSLADALKILPGAGEQP